MQEGDDLARFIEEQRTKLAHDRNILKNNPASAITDNSTNRQYLKNKDKENRVPRDGDVVPELPNGFPPTAPQNAGRPPSTPRIFRLGDDYKRKKEKLQEELREDYRNAMAEKNLRTTGIRHDTMPVNKRQTSDLGLSLPIRDHLSAKVKDAATETYEDLLERKRRQEKSYRAANEGQRDFRERTRRFEEDDGDDDDGYYSQRRVRFPSKGRRARRDRRYYEDEIDFDEEDDIPRRRYSRRGRGRRRRVLSSDDEEDSEEDDRPLRRRRDVSTENKKLMSSFEREATTGSLYTSKEKEGSDDLRSKSAPPEQGFTGLQIGNNTSANTMQRRKEEYRLQLLQQMEEKKQSKKKEREQDLQFDAANVNANDREPKTNRRNEKADASPSKRQAVSSPPPPEEHRKKKEKKSSVRYRLESSSSEEDAPRRRLKAPHPRPSYYPPPGQPALGYYPPQYPSPYDEAYYYYGSRNPLDPPGLMPQPPMIFPGGVSPLLAAAGQQREPNQVEDNRAADANVSRRSFNKNESSLVADDKRDEGKKRQQLAQYQEELKQQIALKEKEKKEAREEQERYDMKMEAEARNYNPWGKGGGGAPMKDRKGNLISDLRQMHIENEEMVRDPTKAEEVVRERLPQTNLYRRDDRPVIDLSPRQGADDDNPDALSPRFGRSNPFELKQSDEQKAQRDQYKDYLQKQIEEKRRIEAEKRERERIEDEKEERRLEEQRKHIQAELEAEQEKERSKKEKARLQNEQLRLEAEERKKAEQRRKMEEEEELRKQKDEELNKKLHATAASPPVPALREQEPAQPSARTHEPPPEPQLRSSRHDTRFIQQPPNPQPSHTPHIQTYRADSPGRQPDRDKVRSRAESKRISRELSALRKQLLSEQRRVENQLRTVDMTGQPPRAKTEYLVDLSKSRQKPVSVRRPPTVENDRPSSKALKEFNDYKHRPDDTASIRMFRAEYPETPSDAKALERQQEALLARQGKNLEQLRQGKHPDQPSPERKRRDQDRYRYRPPPTAQSQASLLQAETSYIPVLPGDEDDELEARFRIDSNQSSPPQSREGRRPSARERRRMAHKPPSAQSERGVAPRARQDNYSLNSLSSLATLDVDRLANKNHNRLEKLRAIQGDEVSLTDPDDILDRFVNKQKGRDARRGRRPTTNEDGLGGRAGPSDMLDFPIHSTRPPSVNTVDTEPWLRPETGPTVA